MIEAMNYPDANPNAGGFTLLELSVVIATIFMVASGLAWPMRAQFFKISTFSARSGKTNRKE